MKISISLVLAGLSALGWTAPATAASPPPGSYRLSCTGAAVQGDTLSASCQSLSGTYQSSTLAPLGPCENAVMKGGDIANLNGNLVCVPNLPDVTGEAFPQSETTVNGWVYGNQSAAMYRHSWAIWAGLTTFTGKVNGTPVRAFQTWSTPSNMIYRIQSGIGFSAVRGETLLQKSQLLRPRGMFELEMPHQFRNLKPRLQALQAVPDGDTNIFVAVAYNPAAAQHAIANKLFLQSTLNRYLTQGYTQIPVFPASAITIKPVYKIIQNNEANGNVKNGIYTMPGWPGTPSPAKTFPEPDWGACVYVDINNTGPSGHAIDQGCSGRTAASTFHLGDFISHTITAGEVAGISAQTGMTVSAGDIAILVGMHVTTRETTRWTWQTFWWSANANHPYTPSSDTIAAARPTSALDAAANHYAMAVAYQMVAPAQPITGGKSVGAPVIAYNPHLEAGFDPSVFQIKRPIDDHGKLITNEYGVQTNCMSCHGLAQYQSTPGYYAVNDGANRETPYGADFYFSLDDPLFKGKLQLDFAWSILGSLVLDDDGGNTETAARLHKAQPKHAPAQGH
jgi:hypothetical protein